jgi:HK97 family phage prohead protease
MADIKHVAYSTLEIKAMTDAGGKRMFTGIATTPAADREGDIVEPAGAEFQLPIPLCWMHNSRDPVGWVQSAKVTDAGIVIAGEVADIPEPASLKDRLDTAWAMLKAGLVRGLSIGFKPLESVRIGDTFSYRYPKWLWLELSPVTIPANGDCSITAIKSFDQAIRRAASGARPVVRLDAPAPAVSGTPLPGVSGEQQARRKGVIYLN